MSSTTNNSLSTSHPHDRLIQAISQWVEPLGYRIIHLEVQTHRQKTLRIFVDHLNPALTDAIGIEDCVKVSRALDEPLDQIAEVEAVFHGAPYELEVSSPGVDRPLRSDSDFQRFSGREVQIHTYRPLTSEEIENPTYQEKNPKQKNFLGTLKGLQEGKAVLSILPSRNDSKRRGKKGKALNEAESTTNSAEGITLKIPLPLISKANLEPVFDFERSDERE